MAYAPLSTYRDRDNTIVGQFVEEEFGHTFEYSTHDEFLMSPLAHGGKNVNFPHRVWVGGTVNDSGWRHALVKGTVAHVIVDEREDGSWTIEKWKIKRHRIYS